MYEVFPIHWEINYKTNKEFYDEIYIWGKTVKNETALIIITNFPNYFRIPIYTGRHRDVEYIKNIIMKRLNGKYLSLDTSKRAFPLYYYSNEKTQFIEIKFKNTLLMNECGDVVKNHSYPICEDTLDFILKFTTEKNLKMTSWISFSGEEQEHKISTCQHEYLFDFLKDTMEHSTTTDYIYPTVLAYDIEVYSKEHYQMPDPGLIADEVYMVSMTLFDQNTSSQFLLTTYHVKPIKNVTIQQYKNEDQLIIGFFEMIGQLSPDIITGYNIFGFDDDYMISRLKLKMLDLPSVGKLKHKPIEIVRTGWKNEGKINQIKYIKYGGILPLDLLMIIKREYHLELYNLDFVSEYFLKQRKDKVSAVDMFRIYQNRTLDQMTTVAEYCLKDSSLVVDLFKKLDVWISAVEFSNVSSVSIFEYYFRGQQIRAVSKVYQISRKYDYFINERNTESEEYEGGYVRDPIRGLHDLVMTVDFSSLYPSIIQAYNIDYTTLLRPGDTRFAPNQYYTIDQYRFVKQDVRIGILPRIEDQLVSERRLIKEKRKNFAEDTLEYNILDKRQIAVKTIANSVYGFLGVQKGGMLPLIEGAKSITYMGRYLIDKVNRYLETELGAKIIYGDTDSTMITLAGLTNSKDLYKTGMRLADEITRYLNDSDPELADWGRGRIKMEYEKGSRMIAMKKKQYIMALYNKDGVLNVSEEHLLYRGLLTRRDQTKIFRRMYMDVAIMILKYVPVVDVLTYIIKECERILSGKIDFDKLIKYIKMGSYESGSNYFLKMFKEKMETIGRPITSGDRFGYVIVETDNPKDKVSAKMMEVDYYLSLTKKPKIDYLYYVDTLKQIDELFETGYISIENQLCRIGVTINNKKRISILTPINLMVELYTNGHGGVIGNHLIDSVRRELSPS